MLTSTSYYLGDDYFIPKKYIQLIPHPLFPNEYSLPIWTTNKDKAAYFKYEEQAIILKNTLLEQSKIESHVFTDKELSYIYF